MSTRPCTIIFVNVTLRTDHRIRSLACILFHFSVSSTARQANDTGRVDRCFDAANESFFDSTLFRIDWVEPSAYSGAFGSRQYIVTD